MESDDNLFMTKVNQAIDAVYTRLNGRTDQPSIVKAIFDYLTSHLVYDTKTFEAYVDAANSGAENALDNYARTHALGFTAYSAFVFGRAVCEGISKAFKILCDMFNVPCACLVCYEKTSSGERGNAHMNNIVTIDGIDTYVDVTYSLPSATFPMIQYNFFMASKEQMDQAFIYDTELPAQVGPLNLFRLKSSSFHTLVKLRPYLASYDARKNNHEIRFRYDGDEVKEDEFASYITKILNRHAPAGKQWIADFRYGVLNAILMDTHQIKKMNANRKHN